MESTINEEKPIDREKTCPLLLRVFCAQYRYHEINQITDILPFTSLCLHFDKKIRPTKCPLHFACGTVRALGIAQAIVCVSNCHNRSSAVKCTWCWLFWRRPQWCYCFCCSRLRRCCYASFLSMCPIYTFIFSIIFFDCCFLLRCVLAYL